MKTHTPPVAIQTEYRGRRFRSRLEARWAVFFDALNFKWEYEPEGFDLGDGVRYLPDFFLPDQNAWVEIKGARASEAEFEKCRRFSVAKDPDGNSLHLIMCGPRVGQSLGEKFLAFAEERGASRADAVAEVQLALRTEHKMFIFEGMIDAGWLLTGKHIVKLESVAGPFPWLGVPNVGVLERAIAAARGARFEHGESGHPTVRRARPN